MRTIFKDAQLQARFNEHGYVIVPFLSTQDIELLLQNYHNLPNVNDNGFFASIYSDNLEYKKLSHEAVIDTVKKIADAFLIDYRVLVASYVTKTPGDNSYMPPHQDWTFVDENNYRSLNIWFPLMDVTTQNGAIYLMDKGQHLDMVVRGTLIPSAFNDVTNMNFNTLTYLPMKAGEVLIYDHCLIHASPPNQTPQTRIAIATSAVPQEAPIIHYFNNPATHHTEKYAVDFDFFMTYTFGFNTMPDNATFIENAEINNPQFTNEQVAPYLNIEQQLPPPKPETQHISFFEKVKQLFTRISG